MPLPPLRISPFTASTQAVSAEGAEEIRKGAEAGQHEGNIEAPIRRDRRPRHEMEFLELHLQAAALRHVGREHVLRHDRRMRDVPAKRVRAGEMAVRRVQRRRTRKIRARYR